MGGNVIQGQQVTGWVTVTWIEEMGEGIIYGPFKTEDEANAWATNLRRETTHTEPIYAPAFNRG